jgi:uncharacterized protein YggU (UPF0235/DUF167 family)
VRSADGVALDVRLTPRGGRDAIEGVERRADGRIMLKARVRAAPFEGQANEALCRLLAHELGLRRGRSRSRPARGRASSACASPAIRECSMRLSTG